MINYSVLTAKGMTTDVYPRDNCLLQVSPNSNNNSYLS